VGVVHPAGVEHLVGGQRLTVMAAVAAVPVVVVVPLVPVLDAGGRGVLGLGRVRLVGLLGGGTGVVALRGGRRGVAGSDGRVLGDDVPLGAGVLVGRVAGGPVLVRLVHAE